jgi:hypothetical protein
LFAREPSCIPPLELCFHTPLPFLFQTTDTSSCLYPYLAVPSLLCFHCGFPTSHTDRMFSPPSLPRLDTANTSID